MDRREFLRNTLAVAALAPLSRLAAHDNDAAAPQVTRRRYRNSEITLPLLGFGLMRLPTKDGQIDMAEAERMVAEAMDAGCNYFDTAYMYHGGASEKFVARALGKYPRGSYFLTSKMPTVMLKTEADLERIFNEQLERTQAEYFDFYLMHWLNADHWKTAQNLNLYEFMLRKKAEGRIRHIGFSYHGEPETLRVIAEAYPWELGQIQLNYLDWELCRSREQYEILTRLNIPVAVMEPLKGGALVNLTPTAREVFAAAAPDAGVASWGLRYAASLPNVQVVLSGMSNLEQMKDNIATFSPLVPLTDAERETIAKALDAYRRAAAIPCTACRYCMPCPAGVDIPRNLAIYNQVQAGVGTFFTRLIYGEMEEDQRAESCVKCGACLKKCPQKIAIPDELEKVVALFK